MYHGARHEASRPLSGVTRGVFVRCGALLIAHQVEVPTFFTNKSTLKTPPSIHRLKHSPFDAEISVFENKCVQVWKAGDGEDYDNSQLMGADAYAQVRESCVPFVLVCTFAAAVRISAECSKNKDAE